MKTISIVVACYNEEKNIREFHQRVRDLFVPLAGYTYELIFVDNVSTDNSRIIYKELVALDSRVKILCMARNTGSSQPSFWAGIQHAVGDAIVPMDGDLQDPPELITQFIKKWEEGYDVVYGVRTQRQDNIVLRMGYVAFYRLFRWLSYLNIPLDSGDFSLIDRKVINVIKKLPEKDLYVRGLRTWAGFKQVGVNYAREARLHGRSSNSFFKHFYWAKKAIVNFSYKPLEFISRLAAMAVIATFFAAGVYLYLHFTKGAPQGFSTLLMVMFIFGTIQLLALSVIGEYLIRIFQEVKARPVYVLDEILSQEQQKLSKPEFLASTSIIGSPVTLITGGAGFIGANLVRRLLAQKDNNIHVLVQENDDCWRLADVREKITVHHSDLCDFEKITQLVQNIKPATIFHLASYGGMPFEKTANKIFDVNLYGTMNLLAACKAVGFSCFINTGSSSEYGMKSVAMHEQDILEPVSDYAVAKAAATQFCLKEALAHKLPIYTVRPFSVYGDYELASRLIPTILSNALADQEIKLSAPNFVRDFIYIQDMIDLLVAVAQKKPQENYIFNAGTGVQSTIGDVVATVQMLVDKPLRVIWGASSPRPWEPTAWVADVATSQRVLGFKAQHTLESGLKKSLRWFEENRYQDKKIEVWANGSYAKTISS